MSEPKRPPKPWQPKSRRALEEAYAAAMRWEAVIVPEYRRTPEQVQSMVDWALAAYDGCKGRQPPRPK